MPRRQRRKTASSRGHGPERDPALAGVAAPGLVDAVPRERIEEAAMSTEDQETPLEFIAASTWQTTLFLGVVTVILGLIVSFRPSGSLNVIAVLVGILMIISGIFHLIRVFDGAEQHRVWLGIAGLLYIVIGVVLIRHLHLTVAVIGLIVGLTWIIQGLTAIVRRRC